MRAVVALALCGAVVAVGDSARALELPCEHEDVLAETAADVVLSGRSLDRRRLLEDARAKGFDGVALHAHEGRDEEALASWIGALVARADGPVVCGEAVGEGRRLVLAAVRGARLWIDGRTIKARLAAGFSAPTLVVEDAAGQAQRLATSEAALAAGVALPRQARRVQLVAEGPAGPRPVAERLLSPPGTITPKEAPPAEPGPRTRAGLALLGRVDSERQRVGAAPLRPNELLAKSAQGHAVRVCETGQVAHRLPGGEDPEERLRAEHIAARAVGEAVARATSADAALAAILESPSHRLTVTERHFTDGGVGQAVDDKGHTCVVVLLAAWPRRLP